MLALCTLRVSQLVCHALLLASFRLTPYDLCCHEGTACERAFCGTAGSSCFDLSFPALTEFAVTGARVTDLGMRA